MSRVPSDRRLVFLLNLVRFTSNFNNTNFLAFDKLFFGEVTFEKDTRQLEIDFPIRIAVLLFIFPGHFSFCVFFTFIGVLPPRRQHPLLLSHTHFLQMSRILKNY